MKGSDFWEHGNKIVQCVNLPVTTDPSGSHQRSGGGCYQLSELTGREALYMLSELTGWIHEVISVTCLSHCYDTVIDRNNFRKRRFILALGLRRHHGGL